MFKNEVQNKGCSCMACSSSWQNIMFLNTQCIAMPIKIRPQLYGMQFQLAKYHVFKHTMHCNAQKIRPQLYEVCLKCLREKI